MKNYVESECKIRGLKLRNTIKFYYYKFYSRILCICEFDRVNISVPVFQYRIVDRVNFILFLFYILSLYRREKKYLSKIDYNSIWLYNFYCPTIIYNFKYPFFLKNSISYEYISVYSNTEILRRVFYLFNIYYEIKRQIPQKSNRR